MTICDDCKHRSGWRTAFVNTGPEKMVVADCMHPVWPEWWKSRNERPIVSPGAGSGCKKHEPRETSKPVFDATQGCAPTLTECPRCKNPHHACDGGNERPAVDWTLQTR